MDDRHNHGGRDLGFVDGKAQLRLWDMNPETSTVRNIVRRRIVQILSQRQEFHMWKREHIQYLTGLLDGLLVARASSQVHYMNLGTLERRVNGLINNQTTLHVTNNLASDTSFSVDDTVPHSWESCNADLSSSDTPYHNVSTSTASGDCAAASSEFVTTCLDNDSASSSLRDGGSTTSHRYIPSGHHRIVANSNVAANGNAVFCSENIWQPVPPVSQHSTGDNHLMPACSLFSSPESTNLTPSVGLTGRYGNVYRTGVEPYLRMKSDSDSSICSAEQDFHYIQQGKFQPFCQRPYPLCSQVDHLQPKQEVLYSQPQHPGVVSHQPQSTINGSRYMEGCDVQNKSCNQADPLQLQQKEEYQQLQLSLENRKSGESLMQKNTFGYIPENGCIRPNPLQIRSQTVNCVAQQFHPIIEGPKRKPSSSTAGSTALGRFQAPREKDYLMSQKFRVLYDHALCCTDHEGKCESPVCVKVKLLLSHISGCNGGCSLKTCSKYKILLAHYRRCRSSTCIICAPDKRSLENNSQSTSRSNTTESVVSSPAVMEPEQPPSKRTKTKEPFISCKSQNDASDVSVPVKDLIYSSPKGNILECKELSNSLNNTPESMELDTGPSSSSSEESRAECPIVKTGDSLVKIKMKVHLKSSATLELTDAQPVKENVHVPVEADKATLEDNCMNIATSDIHMTETKPGKLKKGVSLVETFTPEKLREHIEGLKLLADQSKEKAEENQMAGRVMDMNTCSLCGLKNLRFEPSPRYCAACLRKINPKGVCYSITNADGGDPKAVVCRMCVNKSSNAIIDNTSILKANLRRIENYATDEDLDEWWVHCDKCKTWQHQICTLFNSLRNEAVQADHTCPNCILQEMENGEQKPLSQTIIPGAKELPTTGLSEHIDNWVSRRLKEEREERAKLLGKAYFEVPSAEGLVVRVVSSVVKQAEVKQAFRDIFQEETYPSSFPYKSKAIFLFQKIDGADVCLFGMYVQEYGSICADPNKRRVSISYIDSVKHFQPKVRAVTGEALRTFVYHEILVGYLDYCKKRGFTSCYIWACPPGHRDDDYILYCHPKIQKMPNNNKLREWYRTMILKAVKEKIVADYTNLYNHFFVKSTECKAKITAARLPYFDNDYWPGQAESILQTGDGSKPQKKESKAVTDRVLRAFKRDAKIENPKDVMLMYQLGENIRPSKEDFILVHLWHVCKHCCDPILSSQQWVCNICSNFRLCRRCFLLEQDQETKDQHPTGISEKHCFNEVHEDPSPAATIDDDETIQSEIFDTRLMFLGYCHSNHYQFDSLRRAKHSTMMILHHLHNPVSPALASGCIGCHNYIGRDEGWHCLSCTGYDLCDPCYKKGAFPHEHELVPSAAATDYNSPKSSKSKQLVQELSGAPLLHASTCSVTGCMYPYCRKLKGLFHHGSKCQTRFNGGCVYCQKIWEILHIHATHCATTECNAPRCKDLKEYFKKQRSRAENLQRLQDARRRAGAKERMKERIRRQRKSETPQDSD